MKKTLIATALAATTCDSFGFTSEESQRKWPEKKEEEKSYSESDLKIS